MPPNRIVIIRIITSTFPQRCPNLREIINFAGTHSEIQIVVIIIKFPIARSRSRRTAHLVQGQSPFYRESLYRHVGTNRHITRYFLDDHVGAIIRKIGFSHHLKKIRFAQVSQRHPFGICTAFTKFQFGIAPIFRIRRDHYRTCTNRSNDMKIERRCQGTNPNITRRGHRKNRPRI